MQSWSSNCWCDVLMREFDIDGEWQTQMIWLIICCTETKKEYSLLFKFESEIIGNETITNMVDMTKCF